MRIGLLTTIDTNIGDDFIREGIIHALRNALPAEPIKFVIVNKHAPYSLYRKWHPIYWMKLLPAKSYFAARLISRLTAWAGLSVLESCDAVVQCGAPVYWTDCHKAEWAEIFWRGIVRRLSTRTPVINLAAGSCYPWERIPTTLNSKDAAYIKRIYDDCQLTSVRDSKSHELLTTLGCQPHLLPCSALLAALQHPQPERTADLVFINYMTGGSHYDFDQHIDNDRWADTMREFILEARTQHDLAFICHNQAEFEAAEKLTPDIPRFWPRTSADYFTIASRGKAAVVNRMHASVGLAGLGIPSMAIGADTRMLMIENIGLPICYVKDATPELLLKTLDQLLNNRDSEHTRLLELQDQTLEQYTSALKESLTLTGTQGSQT